MNWPRSLRWRILLGALLWTLGMIPAMHLVIMPLLSHTIHLRGALPFPPGVGVAILIAVFCMLAGILQVRTGLMPFAMLRKHLAAVRDGSDRRMQGTYPTEVQPLVNDLNSLLEQREQTVRRALAKAGDLAHGLKTPLTLLAQEAERAEAAGQSETAAAISQQVERMRRQVDYHLAHARAATSGNVPGASCQVLASLEGLSRTMLRIHADRGLSLQVDASPEHSIRGRREDLDEMLGNLLDNAFKWAKSSVKVRSSMENGAVVVTVDDDGPGILPAMREVVLQRGVRADEAAPGSGFGLAIVSDLAELYGGTISLEDSPLDGLRARLQLPAWQV
jgi:signal transduction histidine kinase